MKIFNLNSHEMEVVEISGAIPEFPTGKFIYLPDQFGVALRIETSVAEIEGTAIAMHSETNTLMAISFIAQPGATLEDCKQGLDSVAMIYAGRRRIYDIGCLDRYLPTAEDPPVLFVATPSYNMPTHLKKTGKDALVAYYWSNQCASSRSR